MPKVKPVRRVFVTKVPAANGNGGGLHVSNSGLAAIAAALAALAIVWAGVRNVATVSDLSVRDAVLIEAHRPELQSPKMFEPKMMRRK